MTARVLCIGSPWGDDRIGWLAAEALEKAGAPGRAEISAHDRPGARLVALMRGAETVVLVDGVRSGAAPGTLHRIEGEAIFSAVARYTSTHGFGLAEAMVLAEKLGELPSRLVLWGVEMSGTEGEALSRSVADALPALVRAVCKEIEAADGKNP